MNHDLLIRIARTLMRHDRRRVDQLRTVNIRRRFTRFAPGSVLIKMGRTVVLCTASVDDDVPAWMKDSARGWITAEYSMLPGSTQPRKRRDRGGRVDGRSTEIQRLIGRSLRAVTDLERLGERLVAVDCDVLDADGGTRTASITGAFVALVDALGSIEEFRDSRSLPVHDSVAAVSVGIVDGKPLLDLDYHEDHDASVDMNIVMTGGGQFIEVQGSGEEATFDDDQLAAMLRLARRGIGRLVAAQQKVLGRAWPFD